MLFCYITAVPKSTRISTRLKTPAKAKITKRPSKNLLPTSIPKSTQLTRSTILKKAQQNEAQSLDSYHTRLRTLATTCEFTSADKETKDQIILSCKSNALRRKALREDLDLTALLKAGRALELSETQAKELESDKMTVNAIKHQKKNETRSKKGCPADESNTANHATGHTRSQASPLSYQNADVAVASTPTRNPVLLETKSATPVANSSTLLAFVGQFHPVQ